ncbi:MAG: hypothetical protein AAF487_04900 [Bacteroidota bacterium]
MPESLTCLRQGREIKPDALSVNWAEAIVTFDTLYNDTVVFKYRTFSFDLSKEYALRSDSIVQQEGSSLDAYRYNPRSEKQDIFGTGTGLNKSGSISRGLNFGNNQDLGVNSNLNLQLSGRVTDDIQILASITDDNIPIQPDGNTQQLQDFDRVFIQLFNAKTKLTAGDFQLRNFDPYFMKYFKRARGGTIASEVPVGNEKVKMEFSAALSKGRFARNVFFGTEGVQGPYRMRGADNESFIIILAGTEKVFIDGKQMKRGEEYDYVINYNSAEVTFTPNQFITKDKRIVIEFQYSDRNYARSLLQHRTFFDKGKWSFDFNVLSESDSKNQPLQQTLDPDDRLLLSSVGDNLLNAVIPSIDSLEFNVNQVFYSLQDSLGYDSVFVFSTNPDSAFYSLAFSDLGQGNGNYVSADFSANGRTYEWVAPDTVDGQIVLSGRFEPVILLISPKKRQMASLGANFRASENSNLTIEMALSNNDLNTFSDLDRQDDVAGAVNVLWNSEKRLSRKDSSSLRLFYMLNSEFVGEHFSEIERFRPTEFERNWNILNVPISEKLLRNRGLIGLRGSRFGELSYEVNTLNYLSTFSGIKNQLNTNLSTETWKVIINASLLSTDGLVNTTFIRHKADISRKFGNVVLGFRDDQEENKQYLSSSKDTLNLTSYAFFDWQGYLSNSDTTNLKYEVFYRQRTDDRFNNSNLDRAAIAEEFGGQARVKINKNQNVSFLLKNRELKINNTEIISDTPESTLLGRVRYNARLAKGGIALGTFYEIGSGLEPRREFIYLEVPAGQGTYIWIDYDGDGIRDLDEFEIAQFAYEANFIRAFTPTDEYSRTFTNQFTQTLTLRPKAFLSRENGIGKFLSRVSNQSTFRIDRKTNREDRNSIYNPFLTEIEDTTLLAFNALVRNTFSFNRASAIWGIDLIWNDNETKQLLSNGFDSRTNTFIQSKIRWNFSKGWGLIIQNENGNRKSLSDFLNNRNYSIEYSSLNPALSFQPNQFWRVKLDIEYAQKENDADLGGEKSNTVNTGTELRYSWPGKGSLQANFNLVDIDFNGLDNSAIGFEMLEGLKSGTNLTWSLFLQRNLSQNLQMNINYNARKSEENKTIHNGGVQVRAFF